MERKGPTVLKSMAGFGGAGSITITSDTVARSQAARNDVGQGFLAPYAEPRTRDAWQVFIII